jgi:hypothetical protein
MKDPSIMCDDEADVELCPPLVESFTPLLPAAAAAAAAAA